MVTIRVADLVDGAKTLSSRAIGQRVRKAVESFLSYGEIVVLDFQGIELITQSFGDEVLGILIRERGLENVKGRVKIANASPIVKTVMKFVISYSKAFDAKRKTLHLQNPHCVHICSETPAVSS